MQFKIQPWAHQHEAIKRSVYHNDFALFFEQGCGKTLTCVNMMRVKYNRAKRILSTLIFCPDIVMSNWKKEILANSHIEEDKIIINSGPGRERAARLMEFVGNKQRKGHIIIMNHASLRMKDIQVLAAQFVERGIFVLDESHKCKSPTTQTTKGAIKIADAAAHRFLLTGTPILNQMWDIFPQYRILDGGATFGKNFYAFKHKYFDDKNKGMPQARYFPNWQPKKGSETRIANAMAYNSVVVRKKDCLDLPPLVKTKVEFDLPVTIRKHYEELKLDFVTYMEDEACVAQLAITKALRLQQMASGFLQMDSGQVFKFDARAKVLKELLELKCPTSKVLVWAVFKENYKTIRKVCDDLGIKYVEVHGEVDLKGKDEAVEKFNTCSDTRVYIGHPGSGGIGVNLTASDTAIVFSRTWNLEYDLQSEARNHRGGSEIHRKITKYDIVAKDTVDETILEALSNKEKMSLTVLKGVAQQMKEGL